MAHNDIRQNAVLLLIPDIRFEAVGGNDSGKCSLAEDFSVRTSESLLVHQSPVEALPAVFVFLRQLQAVLLTFHSFPVIAHLLGNSIAMIRCRQILGAVLVNRLVHLLSRHHNGSSVLRVAGEAHCVNETAYGVNRLVNGLVIEVIRPRQIQPGRFAVLRLHCLQRIVQLGLHEKCIFVVGERIRQSFHIVLLIVDFGIVTVQCGMRIGRHIPDGIDLPHRSEGIGFDCRIIHIRIGVVCLKEEMSVLGFPERFPLASRMVQPFLLLFVRPCFPVLLRLFITGIARDIDTGCRIISRNQPVFYLKRSLAEFKMLPAPLRIAFRGFRPYPEVFRHDNLAKFQRNGRLFQCIFRGQRNMSQQRDPIFLLLFYLICFHVIPLNPQRYLRR